MYSIVKQRLHPAIPDGVRVNIYYRLADFNKNFWPLRGLRECAWMAGLEDRRGSWNKCSTCRSRGVSEMLNGKISRMTADLLAKYLYRLGHEVEMKTSRQRAAAMA